MPAELGAHAIASMLITLCALLLYTLGKVKLEFSSAIVLFVLIFAFELFPYRGPPVISEPVEEVAREVAPGVTTEVAPNSGAPSASPEGERAVLLRGADFLLGFGNEALVTICLLLVLAKGVERSGALRNIGRLLVRLWLFNRPIALLITLLAAAFLSAFVNNTPVVVMILPLLLGVASHIGFSPSGILMPVGFATILGGMCTTIGTSTNLLVASVSRQLGGPVFGIFDFVLPAALAAAAGIVYLWLLAPRLIPDRGSSLVAIRPRAFRAVICVEEDSILVGKTLADVLGGLHGSLRIERVQRGTKLSLVRLPSLVFRPGDCLHVLGPPDAIKEFQGHFDGNVDQTDLHRSPDRQLVEIVVTEASPLHGKRISEVPRVTHGKLSPVGFQRSGNPVSLEENSDPTLATGDLLLVQGLREDIDELKYQPEHLIMDRRIQVARTAKANLTIVILLCVVLFAAIGALSIMVSALCGVGLMLLFRCLSWDEAWRAIDARLVLVIVTSLALGAALSATGATDFIARSFVDGVRGLPPAVVVGSLLVATALLTEVVTNNAIAVIATPIALGIASQLDLPPMAFVLAVLFGANMSFLTPIGYQTNLLVLRAGRYAFSDFARAGIPLQIVVWAVLAVALPWLYL